jgi:hypothetical protein
MIQMDQDERQSRDYEVWFDESVPKEIGAALMY